MISPKPKGWVSGSAGSQGLAPLSWPCSCFCSQLPDWLGPGVEVEVGVEVVAALERPQSG